MMRVCSVARDPSVCRCWLKLVDKSKAELESQTDSTADSDPLPDRVDTPGNSPHPDSSQSAANPSTELRKPENGQADSENAAESVGSTSSSSKLANSGQITDMKDRQLGDFRLLRRIGHGGMAEVYLAEQVSLKRNVAVKVLREEMLADDVHLMRFEQEAKAAGGLNHPNIVQVYSIGHADGIHYIAQEYVQGMNLREFLQRYGPPSVQVSLDLMMQIASALEAAGEAGIVHRDIKPENILITRKNTVKVTDFGLAQLSISGERLNLTQVGMTMGTPLYMSPEQVNGRNVDLRSDIYSFGVTCYHLLSGATPFRGETAVSVAVQHVNKEPPPLQQQRRDLPEIVCRLVHKMMMKSPDDRYQNAESLLQDLTLIVETLRDNPARLNKLRLAESSPAFPWSWWLTPFFGWSWPLQVAIFGSVIVLASAIAAGLGWKQRQISPFETQPAVEKKTVRIEATAMLQYFFAMRLVDDEDAWQAIVDNFKDPKDSLYRRRAREELASIYLRTERYDEAEKVYKNFTVEDDKDKSLIATGHAGLAVIASLQEEYLESQKIIQYDLRPLLQDRKVTIPRQLELLIRRTFERNQQQLGKKSQLKLEELFGPTTPTDSAM